MLGRVRIAIIILVLSNETSIWLSCHRESKFWLLWFISRVSTILIIVTCLSTLLNWIYFALVSENIKRSLPESLKENCLFSTLSKLPSTIQEKTLSSFWPLTDLALLSLEFRRTLALVVVMFVQRKALSSVFTRIFGTWSLQKELMQIKITTLWAAGDKCYKCEILFQRPK